MSSRDIYLKAVRRSEQFFEDWCTELAKNQPDVFRRGAVALLTPKPTAEDLRKERAQFAGLAGNVQAFEAALKQRVAQTSYDETVRMLSGGKGT